MAITASGTTWRYIQTGDPTRATLFFSEDLRRSDGTVVPGPTEDVQVAVTAEEQDVLAALIERGRAVFVDKKNAVSS